MRPPSRRPAVTSLAVLCLLASLLAPAAVGATDEPPLPTVPGSDLLARDSWIVTLVAGADPATEAPGLAKRANGKVGNIYSHALHGFQFHGSAAAAEALRQNPQVASVEADRAVYLTEAVPFGIKRIDAYVVGSTEHAYGHGFRGNGVRIAIIDTGIDLAHEDLAATTDVALGKNCVGAGPPQDGYGHGTHVAGTAASPLNGVGLLGVAPESHLVPVKVFDDAGNSSEALVLCGLDHIIGLATDGDPTNDVQVANMSFGEARAWGDCSNDALHRAICAASAAGITLVGGAGNSAVNANTFVPAAFPEVISVSALADFDGHPGGLKGCIFVADLFWYECDDTFAFFSNWGKVDVMAPGVSIQSTWPGNQYKVMSGTSMATPHVAGVAALMKAANPAITPAQILALMRQTGECPNQAYADADGTSGCTGQGTWKDDPDGTPEPLVNALRAAQAAADASGPAPVVPGQPTLDSASAGDANVALGWSAPSSDGGAAISGYQIWRGTASGGEALLTTTTNPASYTDSTASNGTTYYYQVAAVNSVDAGARSNELSATPQAPPPPPPPPVAPGQATLSSATAGNASVALAWSAPSSDGGAAISGYQIWRGTASGGEALLTTTTNPASYTDATVSNGTTYYYQVAAVNSAGAGPPSNELSATPRTVPGAPRNLVAKARRVTGVDLTWLAPLSNGGSAITEYRIYRGTVYGGARTFLASSTTTSYTDMATVSRVRYYYVVRAVNVVGEGPPSNESNAKTW
jgi:subtilisin family serine protease